MIRRLRWWPDTCACALDLEYDDSITPVVHTCTQIVASCARHAAITSLGPRHVAVKTDNDLKNNVREWMIDNYATLRDPYTDVNGVQYFDFKPTINWAWSFNETTSALTIVFTGITFTVGTRNQIQNALNVQFGVGKVILG